jgi:diaminopimelate epimerase
MSGAGNTFFIFDERQKPVEELKRPERIQEICSGAFGAQADGLVFIKKDSELDFAWDFYNSDGSIAEMCGNAARCASFFIFEERPEKQSLRFRTLAGEIEAKQIRLESRAQAQIQVKLPEVREAKSEFKVFLGSQEVGGCYVNTGVPHFVLEGEPDFKLAKFLRSAKEFGPAGTNVTFFQGLESSSQKKQLMQAVTFERGVEDFTLACGTGAVAAAFAARQQRSPQVELNSILQEVEMPGGVLNVKWEQNIPFLTGPAQFQFRAQWTQEFL